MVDKSAVTPFRHAEREMAACKDGADAHLPTIAITMSEPDEKGQRIAQVQLQVSDLDQFNASIGGDSQTFANGILDSVCHLANDGDIVSEKQANFALSIVRGLHPRDQVKVCSVPKWRQFTSQP